MSYRTVVLQDAAEDAGGGADIDVQGKACGVHFIDVGAPDGTVTFEGAVDAGDTIFGATAVEDAGGSLVTTTTTPGYYRLPEGHGLSRFRAKVDPVNSGAFTIVAGSG